MAKTFNSRLGSDEVKKKRDRQKDTYVSSYVSKLLGELIENAKNNPDDFPIKIKED
jgi:hypothetical protein